MFLPEHLERTINPDVLLIIGRGGSLIEVGDDDLYDLTAEEGNVLVLLVDVLILELEDLMVDLEHLIVEANLPLCSYAEGTEEPPQVEFGRVLY